MSGPIATTSVFDALLECDTLLRSLTFPLSFDTNERPVVFFLGEYNDAEREYIWLVGKVPDNDIEHQGSGPSTRQEVYELQIQVGTVLPGATGRESVQRCKALTAVVESAFRDPVSGQPVLLGLDGRQIARGGVQRVEVNAYPNADSGWACIADLFVRIYARI